MSTINDVARLARVSKATVSRVLTGNRGVTPASRQAVLDAVVALNYRPDPIAQSLSRQTRQCVGVICAAAPDLYTTLWLRELEKCLRQQNKHLLLRFASDAHAVTLAVGELNNGLCDALLVAGADFPLDPLPEKVIFVDCLQATGQRCIYKDYQNAAETAIHYLVRQKRRRIALINFPAGKAATETLQGYRLASEHYLIPFQQQWIIAPSTPLRESLTRLMNMPFPCNALLVSDDQQARRAMDLLQAAQIKVPEQIMIFSLDASGRQEDNLSVPAIYYPLDTLANRAVTLLANTAMNNSKIGGKLLLA